jgi:hypothetical protein
MGDFVIQKNAALELIAQGVGLREAARTLSLPYSTVQYWNSQQEKELSIAVPKDKPLLIAHSRGVSNQNEVAVKLLQNIADFYSTELVLTSDFKKLDVDWKSPFFLFADKYMSYPNSALTPLAGKRKLGQHVIALSPFMRLETLNRLLSDSPSFVLTTGTVDTIEGDCGGVLLFPDGYFIHVEVGYESDDTPSIHWLEKSGLAYKTTSNSTQVDVLPGVPEITFGDLHHPYHPTFDINKIVAKRQIFHDILDQNPISRHVPAHTWSDKIDDHRISLQRLLAESWAEELIIVESNHDYWISNFLKTPVEPTWKKSLLELYYKLNLILLDKGSLNEWLYGSDRRINLINHKKNTIVDSAIHGLHGHKKSRFEKNTLPVLNGLGLVIVLGHTHTPKRQGRVFYGGTNSIVNPSYGGMLGSFAQGDVVKFDNGVFVNWVNHCGN